MALMSTIFPFHVAQDSESSNAYKKREVLMHIYPLAQSRKMSRYKMKRIQVCHSEEKGTRVMYN